MALPRRWGLLCSLGRAAPHGFGPGVLETLGACSLTCTVVVLCRRIDVSGLPLRSWYRVAFEITHRCFNLGVLCSLCRYSFVWWLLHLAISNRHASRFASNLRCIRPGRLSRNFGHVHCKFRLAGARFTEVISNKCIKFAPSGRPIRKSEALLLSAYAQRYALRQWK